MPGQTVRAKKRNEILEPTDPVLPHVVFCHMFRVGGPIREHFSQNFLVVSLFFVALLAIHLVDIMLCWCWAQCHPVLLLSFELCIHFFPDTVTPISQMDPVAYWPETWRGGMKMIPAKWLLRISFIECCLIQNTSKRQTLLKQTIPVSCELLYSRDFQLNWHTLFIGFGMLAVRTNHSTHHTANLPMLPRFISVV